MKECQNIKSKIDIEKEIKSFCDLKKKYTHFYWKTNIKYNN